MDDIDNVFTKMSVKLRMVIIGIIIFISIIVMFSMNFGSVHQDPYSNLQSVGSIEETQEPELFLSNEEPIDISWFLIGSVGKIILMIGIIGILLPIINKLF